MAQVARPRLHVPALTITHREGDVRAVDSKHWLGAELFHEQRDLSNSALERDVAYPVHVARPGTRPALPADDHPVDAAQVELHGRDERLDREEADRGAGALEVGDALVRCGLVLDRDAEPDVLRGVLGSPALEVVLVVDEPLHALGALGEDQELVPRQARHRPEHLIEVGVGHVLVKEVGHRVDEVPGRLLPACGDLEAVLEELHHREREVVLAREHVPANVAVRLGRAALVEIPRVALVVEPEGVAVVAPGRDARAPDGRIPRLLGPLDLRLGHENIASTAASTAALCFGVMPQS